MASVLDTVNYLITLAELKSYLGLELQETADDNRLEEAINAASHLANTMTDRLLRSRSATLYLDGPDTPVLQLPNWPVGAITSIHESTDSPRVWDATTLVSADDYVVNLLTGEVHLSTGAWNAIPQSIRFIGYLGYGYSGAAIPGDLKRAVTQVAAKLWTTERDGLDGKTSAGGGPGGGVNLETTMLTPFAERVFELYRRYNG